MLICLQGLFAHQETRYIWVSIEKIIKLWFIDDIAYMKFINITWFMIILYSWASRNFTKTSKTTFFELNFYNIPLKFNHIKNKIMCR